MDCRLFERLVQLDIDGLLSAKEREDMLRHAEACPSCAALLQDMTELSALLSARLGPAEPPAGFAKAVMAALPELPVKQVKRVKLNRPLWKRWGAVAAAAALLLAVGASGLFPLQPNTPPIVSDPGPALVAEDDPALRQDLPPDDTLTVDTPAYKDPLAVNNEDPFDTAVDDDPAGTGEEVTPTTTDDPVNISDPIIAANIEAPVDAGVDGVDIELDLPRPAVNPPPVNGMFSLAVLAAYEDCDALLPSFNEDSLVKFYTVYKGQNHMWVKALGAQETPEHKEQVQALPALAEIMGCMDESAVAGFSYVSAVSPDGRFVAVNRDGEQPGIWLYDSTVLVERSAAEAVQVKTETGSQISALGGSKVLSWSSDSNKFLYTDATGKLFVYYIYAEQHVLALYGGTVSCASWEEDSNRVVFSGKMEKDAHSAVYTIIVP
ncbi:MAG: zf-HC2 domain-containing protein [Clostridiales bacterium]|nr:zf-HC2 domain-containing protein [Clostridiales bacterium]